MMIQRSYFGSEISYVIKNTEYECIKEHLHRFNFCIDDSR